MTSVFEAYHPPYDRLKMDTVAYLGFVVETIYRHDEVKRLEVMLRR